MQPHEGKIMVIDDDTFFSDAIAMLLAKDGFEVVTINTKEEALGAVASLVDQGIGAVLIDGNLTPASFKGSDGAEINTAIKTTHGEVIRTVGISSEFPLLGATVEIADLLDIPGVVAGL